jgi:hypothetical protein
LLTRLTALVVALTVLVVAVALLVAVIKCPAQDIPAVIQTFGSWLRSIHK